MKEKPILLFSALILMLLLAACGPKAVPTPDLVVEPPAASPLPSELPAVSPTLPAATGISATAVPVAAPTSRGPDLVATDPTTVNLQSGTPTLLEFFAFW